jgi:hypothetical protein
MCLHIFTILFHAVGISVAICGDGYVPGVQIELIVWHWWILWWTNDSQR